MKTLKSIIKPAAMVLVAGLLISGCDALDLSPLDQYGSTSYWKTEAHVRGYMDGIHKHLRDKTFQHSYLFGEAGGGSSKIGQSVDGTNIHNGEIKENNLSQTSPGVTKWGELYGLIFNINLLIERTLEADYMTDEQKSYYLGQAYGLRAFHYFDLYRIYGTAPLQLEPKVANGIIEPDLLYEARANSSKLMAQIKSDLNESLKYFGDNNSFDPMNRGHKKGYWSKAATECLLGEVYLWNSKVTTGDNVASEADLEIAKRHLLNVANNYGLSMMTDFSEVFSVNQKGNQEVIMAVRYAVGEAESDGKNFVYSMKTGNYVGGSFFDESGAPLSKDTLQLGDTGWAVHEYKEGLFRNFDKADSRRDGTFLSVYNAEGSLMGTFLRKKIGTFNTATNKREWIADEILYRLPLVYLMLAEIENMQGGDVAKYINLVRQRAYGENWDAELYGYTNADFTTNELAILREKDKEFVNEGQRWWDVRRMTLTKGGKHLVFCKEGNIDSDRPILDESTEAFRVLWPIDTETKNKDNLVDQTPGYEVEEED